jgi:hypothetical protein
MSQDQDEEASADAAANGSPGVTIKQKPPGTEIQRSDVTARTHIVLANLGRMIAQEGQLKAKQDVKRTVERRGHGRGKR